MKQPQESWARSPAVGGCIERVRRGERLELVIKAKTLNYQPGPAAGPSELQNITRYGPLCGNRPLINWKAHKDNE